MFYLVLMLVPLTFDYQLLMCMSGVCLLEKRARWRGEIEGKVRTLFYIFHILYFILCNISYYIVYLYKISSMVKEQIFVQQRTQTPIHRVPALDGYLRVFWSSGVYMTEGQVVGREANSCVMAFRVEYRTKIKSHQVSISPTFYEQLWRQYPFAKNYKPRL
jgi:hypothetical protein